MDFEVRKLKFRDLMTVGRIVQKMGKKAAQKIVESGNNMMTAGMLIAFSYPEVEADIYKFIADLTGLKVEEVKELEIEDVISIAEAIDEQEDLAMVFTRVKSLMDKMMRPDQKEPESTT